MKRDYKKLSETEKQKLCETANDLLDTFSSIFNIDLEHINSNDENVHIYNLTEDKEDIKDSEENTDNNPEIKYDFSNVLSALSGIFNELFDNEEGDNDEDEDNEISNDSCKCKEDTCKCNKSKERESDAKPMCECKKINPIKQRLIKEATFDKEKYAKELENMICKKIHDILKNEKEHKYKIHKETEKTPAAVEINLKGMDVFLKDNTYILKDVQTSIKNYYDFKDVYINIGTTKNKSFIDLNVYMIL